MRRPVSMEEQLADLAAYAKQNTHVQPSVHSFPPPQVVSADPLDPRPVWPQWDARVPPCSYPTSLECGPPDVYGGGAHLSHFEGHVANLFGKSAALFFVTGTMAQLVSMRIHAQGRNKIMACQTKCHMMLHEVNVSERSSGQ